jgi:hypothetical protein
MLDRWLGVSRALGRDRTLATEVPVLSTIGSHVEGVAYRLCPSRHRGLLFLQGSSNAWELLVDGTDRCCELSEVEKRLVFTPSTRKATTDSSSPCLVGPGLESCRYSSTRSKSIQPRLESSCDFSFSAFECLVRGSILHQASAVFCPSLQQYSSRTAEPLTCPSLQTHAKSPHKTRSQRPSSTRATAIQEE